MKRGRKPADEPAAFDSLLGTGNPPDGEADDLASDDPTTVIEGVDEPPVDTSRVQGWRRVFRGNKTLWITAVVAVLALATGLLAERFIISPADAAANAKTAKPGLVTAPVEFGELSNDVTIRADVGYADAVDVTIDTAGLPSAVVTGRVPAVGDTLDKRSVAMEVAGRPVIVLPGELPAYRTLSFGASGPDVKQLKQSLAAVGISAGDAGSDVFDQALADGIGELYKQVGYPAPASAEGADDAYRAAQKSVTAAEQGVASAQAALAKADAGPDDVQARQAQNDVNAAQRSLDEAVGRKAPDSEVSGFRDALSLAQLQRDALYAGKDTSAESAAVDAASEGLTEARNDLERARQAVQPVLPAGEVVFLTNLPRRVDEVTAKRGSVLSGVAMRVSGATVQLNGSVAAADAKLLKVGDTASFGIPDGDPHPAKITKLEQPKSDGKSGDRWSVVLEPDPLTPEQITALQGNNVRVSIPVGATEGEVLSVPLAAVTAGAGGDSRVEVVDGDPRDGEKAKTHLVTVELGLSADGFVEVKPAKGELAKGDLVVIGE